MPARAAEVAPSTVTRGRALAGVATGGLFAALAAMAWVQGVRAAHNGGADIRGYAAAAEALLAGHHLADAWVNSWPPFFSLFVVPVAWLWRAVPGAVARLAIVYAANLALTAAWVGFSVRAAAGPRRAHPAVYALTALCAAPYLRDNLQFHQVNVAVAFLAAGGFALLDRRRDGLAGALVGVATSIKVQPVLLVPYLVRRPRALGATLVAVAACAVAPALAYGPRALLDAYRFWFGTALPAHVGAFGVSLPAVMHEYLARPGGRPPVLVDLGERFAEIAGAGVGLAAVALVYRAIFRRAAAGVRQPAVLDVAQILPAAIVTGALAWRYHLVALVPAIAATLVYLAAPGASPKRRAVVAALFATSVCLGAAAELGAIAALEPMVDRFARLGGTAAATYLAIAALEVARRDPTSQAFLRARRRDPAG